MNKGWIYQIFLLIIYLLLIYNTLSLKKVLPEFWAIPSVYIEALFTASFSFVVSISVYYLTVLIPLLITRGERKDQLKEKLTEFIYRAEELLEGSGLLFRDDSDNFFEQHEEMRKANREKGLTHYSHLVGRNRTDLGHKLVRLKKLRDGLQKSKNSGEYADLRGSLVFDRLNKLTESPLFHPNNNYLKKSEAELADCEIEVWQSLLDYRKMINTVKTNI